MPGIPERAAFNLTRMDTTKENEELPRAEDERPRRTNGAGVQGKLPERRVRESRAEKALVETLVAVTSGVCTRS